MELLRQLWIDDNGDVLDVPIAVGIKWFPDKKGIITGLAVAGFGFGATIWVKLAGAGRAAVRNSKAQPAERVVLPSAARTWFDRLIRTTSPLNSIS